MKKKKIPRGYPKGEWSPQAIRVMEERYLIKDLRGRILETPDEMCWRVANEVGEVERNFGASEKNTEEIKRKFYELMVKKFFLPNSPTLMNAGRGNNLQYSACFVLPVGDSLTEIFEAIKRAALIHQSGGGTGFSFSRIRPKGSIVRSTRGVASGPVSFMRVFDAATAEIKQGGMRRGANMGVLRVDHPDILEFIESKKEGGITNFNISVAATDEFMKAVKKDGYYWLYDPFLKKKTKKIKAKEVFEKICQMAWATGDPGMIFIDKINQSPANPVPEMGPIEATNPCVVGSTLIATEKGLVRIKDLVRKKMEVRILTDNKVLGGEGLVLRSHNHLWDNGKKKVWLLRTKSGFELKATPDHKIMTKRGWVPLEKLKIGKDEVLLQSQEGSFNQEKKLPFYYPGFPSNWSKKFGQVLGWLIGDGWLSEDKKNYRVGFSFGADDKRIMEYFRKVISLWYGREVKPVLRQNGVYHLSYHSRRLVDFFKKLGVKAVKAEEKEVPESVFTAPKEGVIGFLQGLFTADGTVNFIPGKSAEIRLTSKSKKLLKEVQVLLLNLGIPSVIYNRYRSPQEKFFYKNKKGEKKSYLCDGICFELVISRQPVLKFLKEIGFLGNKHKQKIKGLLGKKYYQRTWWDPVVEVKPAGEEEVFDITEPVTYSMIANGIVIADCGEQPLYPNEACNLGSINLALMVKKEGRKKQIDWDKLEGVVRLAVRFLDNVIDINPFPLEEITQTVKSNRRIGLGVMGWADLLFQLEIPYESKEAVNLAKKVMKFIQKVGHQASFELAKERGPFPNFPKSIYKDGPPLRNATVTTIAPTGSLSILANCSSGIEPLFALAYRHKTKDRELTFINPYFLEAAKKYHLDKEVIKKVEEEGSLKNTSVSSRLKKIFATAHEISWKGHIDMQAAFQQGTDNAVSKTINFPHEATVEDVYQAYLYAYQKGCRGITVYRDRCKEEQVLYAGKQEKEEKKKLEIKPRPTVVSGKTYRIVTPVGTAFITINVNGDNQPLEVFITVGKAGSDVRADSEAIGRLISLCLRLGSDFSPQEVLAQIIDQLEGIGGSESVGFGKERIRSLADGVAKVLKNYLAGDGEEKEIISEQPSLISLRKKGDLCPKCGQATLIYEEGCLKCSYCGFNKC